jgi:hypothetical protein
MLRKLSHMLRQGFVVLKMDLDGNCHMRNAFGYEVVAEDDTLGQVRRQKLSRREVRDDRFTARVTSAPRERIMREDRWNTCFTASGRRKEVHMEWRSHGKRGRKISRRDYIKRAQLTNIIPVGM